MCLHLQTQIMLIKCPSLSWEEVVWYFLRKPGWLAAGSYREPVLDGSLEPRRAHASLPLTKAAPPLPVQQGPGQAVPLAMRQCHFVQTDWLSPQWPSCRLYYLKEIYGWVSHVVKRELWPPG